MGKDILDKSTNVQVAASVANGVLHGATKALEDTEYLFICNGPVLFYSDEGLTNYLSWEEFERMKNGQPGEQTLAG